MGASGRAGWRCGSSPTARGLTVLAHNFRNAYELAVDSFGDLWQNDNDDQVMACRMTWLMEGASAGYFSVGWDAISGRPIGGRGRTRSPRTGIRTIPASCRRATTPAPALRLASSATRAIARPPVSRPAPQRRCRTERDLRLSPESRRAQASRWNVSTSCRASRHRIPTTSGTGSIRIDASGFGRATSRSGPDGAIYVADWFDPIVGGHQMQDRQGIRPDLSHHAERANALTTPSIDLRTTAGQIQALLSPAVNVRSGGFDG